MITISTILLILNIINSNKTNNKIFTMNTDLEDIKSQLRDEFNKPKQKNIKLSTDKREPRNYDLIKELYSHINQIKKPSLTNVNL